MADLALYTMRRTTRKEETAWKPMFTTPAYEVWSLAEELIRFIPLEALLKWHDGILQYAFHLGGGVISARN